MTGAGIYQIANKITGERYVGSAVSLKHRWRRHREDLAKKRHHSRHLQNAWDKYGRDAFEFSVLEEIGMRAALISREQYWMDALRAGEFGYNICPTAGSNLGSRHSEETRAKMSAWQIGRKMSPEAIAKSLAARRGYKTSDETKAKLSAALKGVKKSPEARANIIRGITGRRYSAEQRARMGRPCSPERRARISKALMGRVFSAEVIARRVATRARNAQLRRAEEAIR